MQEYKAATKFKLGQQNIVAEMARKGDLRMGFVKAILPIFLEDRTDVFYVLDVDYGNSNPTELLNRAYSESQLLTLEEGKKAASEYFLRMAELVKSEKVYTSAEEHYVFKK